MQLRLTLSMSVLLMVSGSIAFYFLAGLKPMLWFSLGAGLALINVFAAAFAVRFGLQNLRKKPLFIGLLLLKSLTFFVVVAVVLVFLKPLVLPFTLGISVVIVGATVAALWEARRYRAPLQVGE